MADTKLSALDPLAVEMADSDEIYLNNGGVSNRQLYSVFKAAFATAAQGTTADAAVAKALFDANTILTADSDDTPAALAIAEQTLVGRITAGNIVGLTATQIRTLLNVADGATVDQTNISGNAGTVTTNANLTGVVTSAGNATAIADKALAIAKLADGTDGELITWGTDGVITTVAVGTATQVLTSAGADAVPTWEDAGGGGGFTSIVDDETNGNYAIGLNALNSLTEGSGTRNIAIGEDAGTGITTSDDCVAIGDLCLTGGAALAKNTAVGARALRYGTGTGNSAFGYSALGASGMSGGSNNAFGNDCLGGITSGTNNCGIGLSAGDNLTTGNRCFIMADNADFPSATDDWQIVIGKAITGVAALSGYVGAALDDDMSGKTLTLTGPSALPAASTNQDGGNLVLQGGLKASGGGANGLIVLNNLPTSDPTVAGALWANSNVVTVSTG
jgi:hypothetical protein